MIVWTLMLIMDLTMPLIMIGFGSRFIKKLPKSINMIYGYRTAMSTKNADTWSFAHRHIGKTWRLAGWITFAVTFAAFLAVLLLGGDAEFVAVFGGWVCGVQLILLICSIIPTERALKKNFNRAGYRISEIKE